MHLPLAHLSGFEENEDEELQAQLQAHSGSQHSHEDEEGSQSHSQGSKEGSGGSAPGGDGAKPPKDLPCPRCQSMNTKFCYYNNYSVNQPRHFCRNCQRYWTVGGTLRNVPVGGGSRKKSRTRSRSDPYYRPPAPSASDDSEHAAMAGAMAGEMHPAEFEGGFPDFPFHPAAFLQLAAGMDLNPFQAPAFGMAPEEEAELQAFYEASQGGFLSSAAAMMSAGLFLPELEPAHLALMHKATLWAEAQRLQAMARRQTAAAWVAEEQRECKPSVAPNPAMAAAELRNRHQRRPGFWETALMHSRPSSKATPIATRPPPPGSSSQTTTSSTPPPTPATPWADAETKPLVQNPEDAAAASAYSSQAGYVDETTSWGSGPDMYY